MNKIFKKAIAIFLAATMALTPILVSADETECETTGQTTDQTVDQFEVTARTAAAQAAAFAEAFSIAGITIAVVDLDSDFTWFYSFGYADAVDQVPVTEHTIFPIASVAKLFTAVAVMQLVEAGVLDLDEPIVTYLPGFSLLPNPLYGGDYRNITTRMLLTHTSGIHEFQGEGAASIDGQDRSFMNSLVPLLTEQHMQNVELNRITYSNTGYIILGILVAALTDSENYFDGFIDFTQENIFTPAGMPSSSFAVGGHNRAYIALPHLDATTALDEFLYVGGTPSGGMVSNAYDMARFMHIMLNGGALGSDEETRILSEEIIQAMLQVQYPGIKFPTSMPTGMQYGLGILHLSRPSGVTTTGHAGNLQHHSDMILDFENGIGVFVSVNSATGAAAAMPLAEAIWVAAVYEKTGEAVPTDAYFGTPFITQDLLELAGWYTIVGQLVLNEDGVLTFPAFPGVPFPIELTPAEGGTFDSVVGSFWFTEVEDIMFAFLETTMLGERVEVPYATPAIDRWLGEYVIYTDGQVAATMIVGVNEYGFPFADFDGAIFLMHKVDDYTYVFPGRGRGLGSVAQFSMDGDTAVFRYSGSTMTRAAAAPTEALPLTELRFVIGSTEYTRNEATYQMNNAPFIDAVYSRTMIPLHVLNDIFDADNDFETTTIMLGEVSIAFPPINESLPNSMGAVHYIDGNIFLPLAYVFNAVGAEVLWDGANQAIYIWK